jgi:DNA-binding MarR family transcriptional regulator
MAEIRVSKSKSIVETIRYYVRDSPNNRAHILTMLDAIAEDRGVTRSTVAKYLRDLCKTSTHKKSNGFVEAVPRLPVGKQTRALAHFLASRHPRWFYREEVAPELGLRPNQVTTAVSGMRLGGLVAKHPDDADCIQGFRFQLTTAGARLMHESFGYPTWTPVGLPLSEALAAVGAAPVSPAAPVPHPADSLTASPHTAIEMLEQRRRTLQAEADTAQAGADAMTAAIKVLRNE